VCDPAQIKACCVRKQKTDRRDASHILKLMVEDAFRGCGCRVRRIGICANCFGIVTG
jgi:hypothetical protein